MSNEHITDGELTKVINGYTFAPLHIRKIVLDALALRPAAQPLAYAHNETLPAKGASVTRICEPASAPATQPVGEPVKPFFATSIASRKWAELQEQGHRMQHVAFDGGPGGAGVIDPWGKVTWGPVPDRVPMTDEQRSLIIERAVDKTVDRSAAALYAICETERLYGITTPKADK